MPNSSRSRIGFWVAAILAVLVICGVGFHFARVRICDGILEKIDRLTLNPPDGMSELEWAVHVYWTHNLHCNSMLLSQASYGELNALNRTLDNARTSGADTGTIDAIWDIYARLTPAGKDYQSKYEAEKNSIAELVSKQGTEFQFASDYQGFLESLR